MRKVADIMTKEVFTVTPQDHVYDCAVLMKQHDIGFVPVVEGRKLVGVVTDRDLVVRGYAEKHQGSEPVTTVMSKDVETISPNLSVDEAAEMMSSRQIRRLPVVENGELCGVVALGDLAVRDIFVNEAGDALSEISERDSAGPSFAH